MSAFVTEYPDLVRAVVSDVGIITDITGTQVQAVRCKALWDTGAVYSVISNAFAAKLRLQEFDRGRNYTAQGSYETSVYLLSIVLPNGIVVPDLRVSSGEFQDFDFLLGMDVISQGDFHLTNNGHSKFLFRIPPEA